MNILSFLALCIIHCIYQEAHAKEEEATFEHFLVSDRDNDKINIIGPNLKTEVELNFKHEDKFIKTIKAQYEDGVLTFFWIYFNNDGEVNIGKVSNENPELETSSVIISKTSSLTDVDVLDDLLFVSTSTGEIYTMNVKTQDVGELLDDKASILAVKTDNMHRQVYFTQCSGKSVLVSKSISMKKEYNTPLCFHAIDIDHDANILYAAASNRIYSWKIPSKDFSEIHNSGAIGEIRNIVNGDEYLYFKTKGDRCFKLDKKDNTVVEIPELCAVSHFGPLAYFKAPVFVPPPTTQPTTTETTTTETTTQATTTQTTFLTTVKATETNATDLTAASTGVPSSSKTTVHTTKSIIPEQEKNWFIRYFWWIIFLLILLLIIIVIVIVIICACRKKKEKNYEQM